MLSPDIQLLGEHPCRQNRFASRRSWVTPFVRCAAIALVMVCGCDFSPSTARPLPVPAAEQPPANLPAPLHQRNWTGPLRQGSCVHASTVNHMRWLNLYELGEKWRATYSDGEYDDRLRKRLDAADVDYSFTLRADPRFLDWATESRRGAILWWKPSHCCTFMGSTKGVRNLCCLRKPQSRLFGDNWFSSLATIRIPCREFMACHSLVVVKSLSNHEWLSRPGKLGNI